VKKLEGNKEIAGALRRRAAQTARSLRWNGTSLMLACLGLVSTILMALSSARLEIVVGVAAAGLATVWACSEWHVRRLESEAFDEEMSVVTWMLSGHAHRPETVSMNEAQQSLRGTVLSCREIEALHEAALGKSNKEIAMALGITERTVKNHLCHAFKKLDVSDRTAAVLVAVASGSINKLDASPGSGQHRLEEHYGRRSIVTRSEKASGETCPLQ